MDCTVRYVAANPRHSEIVSIGADNDPGGHTQPPKIGAMIFGGIFCGAWGVGSAVMAIQASSKWTGDGLVVFFVVLGIMLFLSFGALARTTLRKPPIPGCTKCDPLKDAKITSLNAPYQKPQPVATVPVAAVPVAAVPMATTAPMTVTCPDGVAPGQSIQISLPDGTPMQVQVPPNVLPGGVFQVVVPSTVTAQVQP